MIFRRFLGATAAAMHRTRCCNSRPSLRRPLGYSFRGKQWLEHGLLGYGGAYKIRPSAMRICCCYSAPTSRLRNFLPGDDVKKIQIDRNPKHIGRRTAIDLGSWATSRRPSRPYSAQSATRAQFVPRTLAAATSRQVRGSSPFARNSWRRSASWPPTTRCFSWTRAPPGDCLPLEAALGLGDIS